MLWVYGHYTYFYYDSAGIDFSRQNLTIQTGAGGGPILEQSLDSVVNARTTLPQRWSNLRVCCMWDVLSRCWFFVLQHRAGIGPVLPLSGRRAFVLHWCSICPASSTLVRRCIGAVQMCWACWAMMLLLLMNIKKKYFYFIIYAYFNLINFIMDRPYVFFIFITCLVITIVLTILSLIKKKYHSSNSWPLSQLVACHYHSLSSWPLQQI